MHDSSIVYLLDYLYVHSKQNQWTMLIANTNVRGAYYEVRPLYEELGLVCQTVCVGMGKNNLVTVAHIPWPLSEHWQIQSDHFPHSMKQYSHSSRYSTWNERLNLLLHSVIKCYELMFLVHY